MTAKHFDKEVLDKALSDLKVINPNTAEIFELLDIIEGCKKLLTTDEKCAWIGGFLTGIAYQQELDRVNSPAMDE